MTLSDLPLVPGSSFQLDCRIRHPRRRIAANGSPYLAFDIEDCCSSLKAYAWPEQCDISTQIHDLEKVLLSGKVREFSGNPLAAVKDIQSSKSVVTGAVNLIPHSLSPEPQLLGRLSSLVSRIANKPLRCFLDSVFSDDGFALQFVRLPASRHHHHAAVGGLLKHSLECAEMVQTFSVFSPDMLDLAVVGALLHDAGKVMTLHSQKFTPEYVLLDHDALTLEVLAPHLKHLDSISRETATALRYLWTWRHSRRARVHPALVVAEAITAADRISTGLDFEEDEFNTRPQWQSIMRSKVNGTMLWRPQLGCNA
jgi:3'-5' exoribonuclease